MIFGGGTLQAANTFASARAIILSGNGTIDTNGNSVTLSGPIGGASNLAKTGAGTLILSGPNTYTGTTTINEGTLMLGAAGAFGDGDNNTSGVTVAATGAALDLNGVMPTANAPLNLNGTGVSNGGALTNSGASTTYGGTVTLQAASTIGGSGSITLNNIVGGAFGLTYAGQRATLILSGASNGITTMAINSGGTVQIGPVARAACSAVDR